MVPRACPLSFTDGERTKPRVGVLLHTPARDEITPAVEEVGGNYFQLDDLARIRALTRWRVTERMVAISVTCIPSSRSDRATARRNAPDARPRSETTFATADNGLTGALATSVRCQDQPRFLCLCMAVSSSPKCVNSRRSEE